MFNDWAVQYSKSFTVVVTREDKKTTYTCDSGPIFQVYNLYRNHTLFRASIIQYQPSPTAWPGRLEIR